MHEIWGRPGYSNVNIRHQKKSRVLLAPASSTPTARRHVARILSSPMERVGELSRTRVTQARVNDVLHLWTVEAASPVGGKPCLQGLGGCKRMVAISIAWARLDVKVTGGLQHSSCMPVCVGIGTSRRHDGIRLPVVPPPLGPDARLNTFMPDDHSIRKVTSSRASLDLPFLAWPGLRPAI